MTSFKISSNPVFKMGDVRRINIKKSAVRKNLFGPVNHAELKLDLIAETEKIKQQDRNRWNFDFDQEKPLLGRYEWMRVGADYEMPAAYILNIDSLNSTSIDANVENNNLLDLCNATYFRDIRENEDTTNSDKLDSSSSNTFETYASGSLPQNQSTPFLQNKKQSRITDYLQNRKRKIPELQTESKLKIEDVRCSEAKRSSLQSQ